MPSENSTTHLLKRTNSKPVMSEYEKIKKNCQKVDALWEDPQFPAVQSSVFYHQTPPFQFVWKRPKELVESPIFIKDSPCPFDVTPGKLGDRWFVSCIGTLYLLKGFFYRVVPADQSFEITSSDDSYCGAFRFRLWWCGEWVEVVIDDRLPTFNGKLVFAHCQSSGQFWPCLLEKAYAKLHGSYEALKYGTTLDGLADLTGGITESVQISNDFTNTARLLTRLLSATSVVTVTTQASTNSRSKVEKLDNGILIGMNYKVVAVDTVDAIGGDSVQLVKLKHPYSKVSDWSGPWSRSSREWDSVSISEVERLGAQQLHEGEFWLSYTDFCTIFNQIEIIHVDSETARDEVTLHGRAPWVTRLHQGAWQRGVTAGGCRNNPDTFHINPQLNLILSENEEVIISLCQHSVLEPKVIGFSVYRLTKPSSELISKSFFKKNRSIINSQYTNSRQVSSRCCLEQGGYLLVPTTFESGQESSFTLRVFSAEPIKLKLIDTVPQMLRPVMAKAASSGESKGITQYESVFLQLADEHRSVSCFELHELLEACLPNDYIKSCATIEVCRQVVMALDTSGYGRLRLSEFRDFMCSLKQWQIAFKTHSKEKTGILRAERLRDALYDTGFQVNTEILSSLALRYMRKDGTLRFGDYVSIVLLLSSTFGAFDKRNPLQNGTIKLSLSEYLGKWYQQERLFSWLELVGDCWVHEYFTDPTDEGIINLEMRFNIGGKEASTGLNVYQQDENDPAAFTSMFQNLPFTAEEYKVLATDYTSWAIEYRCQNRGYNHRRESLWILTRDPFPPSNVTDKAIAYLKHINFKTESLGKVDQSCHDETKRQMKEEKREEMKKKQVNPLTILYQGPARVENLWKTDQPIEESGLKIVKDNRTINARPEGERKKGEEAKVEEKSGKKKNAHFSLEE